MISNCFDFLQNNHLTSFKNIFHANDEENIIPMAHNKDLILLLDFKNFGQPGMRFGAMNLAITDKYDALTIDLQSGISLHPGIKYFITLFPIQHKSEKEDVESLERAERKCLYNNEFDELKTFKFYTNKACKLECAVDYQLSNGFSCLPFFYVPFFTSEISICSSHEVSDKDNV